MFDVPSPHSDSARWSVTAKPEVSPTLSQTSVRNTAGRPVTGSVCTPAKPLYAVLDRDAETGKRYGLAYAEAYHYIGPPPAKVEEYVRTNAVRL